jgi:predicted nucleotidyltransferase
MVLTPEQKAEFKETLRQCLRGESEITKIVLFGSFVYSDDPSDIDVAVFQSSTEAYLPLALKYRKKVHPLASQIPVDVFPLKAGAADSVFMQEINRGEVIYER